MSPDYRNARREISGRVKAYNAILKEKGLRDSVTRIPVVVHVVLKGDPREIVPPERVREQVNALNRNYLQHESDLEHWKKIELKHYNGMRANFVLHSANTNIRFMLARRDMLCRPTTGIIYHTTDKNAFNVRFNTSSPPFEPIVDEVKDDVPPWSPKHYLNIWVCRLNPVPWGNSNFITFGYGAFPAWPEKYDGVVIDYRMFGLTPVEEHLDSDKYYQYNKGKTLTQEAGHWLDVHHLSGDLGNPNCTNSDYVDDTPNQAEQNQYCPGTADASFKWKDCKGPDNDECPAYQYVSCPNALSDGGDMFMNFMDYTLDKCKAIITAGQAMRMDATLSGERKSIADSLGWASPPGHPGEDLWVSDSPDDVGDEPDNDSMLMFLSDDIWINQRDYGLPFTIPHENPLGGTLCKVYVRVRNRGCLASPDKSSKVILYWAKASTALAWPAPWDGSVTSPAVMGGIIGERDIIPIPPGSSTIVDFDWQVPDPEDYAGIGAGRVHFCLLARIISPSGMTAPEGPDLWENVKKNNNIGWKNITVAERMKKAEWAGEVLVGAFRKLRVPWPPYPEKVRPSGSNEAIDYRLTFLNPAGGCAVKDTRKKRLSDEPFYWGDIEFDPGPGIFKAWDKKDYAGEGLERLEGTVLKIARHGAWMDIRLKPGDLFVTRFTFKPREEYLESYHVFPFDLVQAELRDGIQHPVGGQRFVVKTIPGYKV
jgi:hypothetical protein